MHSYFDDKDGKSCNKTGKKGCKKQKNQNMLLSNSLSKKGSFKSPKIMKESPKVVKQKKTVVV